MAALIVAGVPTARGKPGKERQEWAEDRHGIEKAAGGKEGNVHKSLRRAGQSQRSRAARVIRAAVSMLWDFAVGESRSSRGDAAF